MTLPMISATDQKKKKLAGITVTRSALYARRAFSSRARDPTRSLHYRQTFAIMMNSASLSGKEQVLTDGQVDVLMK